MLYNFMFIMNDCPAFLMSQTQVQSNALDLALINSVVQTLGNLDRYF